MADDNKYSVSVRSLVEYCALTGDIDNRYMGADRLKEGVRVHRYIQKNYNENDMSEVAVKYCYLSSKNISLLIRGRIDGVLKSNDGICIEEIKSTLYSPDFMSEPVYVHKAQCMAYAYIYCFDNELDKIKIKVTYCDIKTNIVKSFEYDYYFDELKEFFFGICEKYADYLLFISYLKQQRDNSIDSLEFPFEYRKYQKQAIKKIFDAINCGKNIFINAPTGTGKTLNALFPALKALRGKNAKIFYLTAKSTQKQVANNAVRIMIDNGLKAKALVITAKEKICFYDVPSCNPNDCEYARGYYDKLNDAVKDMISKRDIFDEEYIISEAKNRGMCPFELSLDLAAECDIIICDYNYIFDPFAVLKRFFEEPELCSELIILIDEAHNLVDRAREMYSARLCKTDFLKLRKKVDSSEKPLYKSINEINKILLSYKKKCSQDGTLLLNGIDEDLKSSLYRFEHAADKYLLNSVKQTDAYKSVYEMYFEVNTFLSLCDIINQSHRIYYDSISDSLHLFCTDAKEYLKKRISAVRACVMFSATLSPMSYFCEVLGGGKDDYLMDIPSAFEKDNFKIVVDTSIHTDYKKRKMYYTEAAMRIHAAVISEKGNRLVFFPSYAYMQSVYDEYTALYSDRDVLLQQRNLTEAQRADFIAQFTNENALTAFVVTGGAFSEAIDLTGKRLIGCVVCGVSLPMVCMQRELIRENYEKEGKNGFEYAYVYPGMNKVLQAMGRVIRTYTDTGSAVLLDARFKNGAYQRCFPPHYSHRIYVNGQKELEKALGM